MTFLLFFSRLSDSLPVDGNFSRHTPVLYGNSDRSVLEHRMHWHVSHDASAEGNGNRSGGGQCLLRVLLLGDHIVSHSDDLLLFLQEGALGGLFEFMEYRRLCNRV